MVFQEYRVLLEQASWWKFNSLFDEYQPSVVVNEIIPAVSANSNFVLATQSYLANVVVTMLHANAVFHNTEIHQIAARQVHSTIVTNRKKGQKVTKLQVCNSVVELVPSLAQRRGEWAKSKHWDESDAIAIGIAYVKLHQ